MNDREGSGANETTFLVVREMTRSADRDAALALLVGTRSADAGARLFAACDPATPAGEAVVAAAMVVLWPNGVAELRVINVTPTFGDRAKAGRLLRPLADMLRAEGWRSLVAAVDAGDTELRHALERDGFRPSGASRPDGSACLTLAL